MDLQKKEIGEISSETIISLVEGGFDVFKNAIHKEHEIQLKTLEIEDKENDRKFILEERESKFLHRMVFSIISLFAAFIISVMLLSANGFSIGEKLLSVFSYMIGGGGITVFLSKYFKRNNPKNLFWQLYKYPG
jgi:hypothetical protein